MPSIFMISSRTSPRRRGEINRITSFVIFVYLAANFTADRSRISRVSV